MTIFNRSRSVSLLAACAKDDEKEIVRLGWGDVLIALRFWRKRLDGNTLAPYAALLGDLEPAEVVTAIHGLATEIFRPGAAEIYVRVVGNTPIAAPGSPVHLVRPDQRPETYRAVLQAVAAGEYVCDCIPRPADVNVDPSNVLRCPSCGGLEVGQYEAALEAQEIPT